MSTETEMPAATLEALRGSIAKWEGIVAGTTKNEAADNCPLCRLFSPLFADENGATWVNPCVGCPVFAVTGKEFCAESPYEEYERLEEDYGDDPDDEQAAYMKGVAQKELDFLKSLLPRSAT